MIRNFVAPKKQIYLVISYFCCASICIGIANAYPQSTSDHIDPERLKKHLAAMKEIQQLKEPAGFSDLPEYNGKKQFVNGCTQSKNGTTMSQMKYISSDDSEKVLDFYKTALPSNGWKILYVGKNSITARHNDGHMCAINTTQSRLPGTKCKFHIAYRQIQKQH